MSTEVTVTEAGRMLGMSRDQVEGLLREGELVQRSATGREVMVDAESVRAFKDSQRERSRTALADLAALQNELGLTDGRLE